MDDDVDENADKLINEISKLLIKGCRKVISSSY